ncbi:hypothetical protein [Flavicella sediminum]|uniref:hypothetical protein n=1 Tax=Flavicella sediminum TaxID=2585141 RepID=UPI001120D553|nr:hypothetical protein [Flavicella sediminum]
MKKLERKILNRIKEVTILRVHSEDGYNGELFCRNLIKHQIEHPEKSNEKALILVYKDDIAETSGGLFEELLSDQRALIEGVEAFTTVDYILKCDDLENYINDNNISFVYINLIMLRHTDEYHLYTVLTKTKAKGIILFYDIQEAINMGESDIDIRIYDEKINLYRLIPKKNRKIISEYIVKKPLFQKVQHHKPL